MSVMPAADAVPLQQAMPMLPAADAVPLQQAMPVMPVADAVPLQQPIAPVAAVPMAAEERRRFEEKVRLLEPVMEHEAIAYNRSLSGDDAKASQPSGCYLCAPVGCGIKSFLGGIFWAPVGKSCIFGGVQCCLGIPLPWQILMPATCCSDERDARGSVNGWQFRGRNSGDLGRLYLVDVEKNTFAFFSTEECMEGEGVPCCYCKHVM